MTVPDRTPASILRRRLAVPRSYLVPALLLAGFLAGCAPDADVAFDRARSNFEARDYREALIHARNALQARPSHVDARLLLARAALALGDYAEAETQLRRAAEAGAGADQYALPMAEVLYKTRNVPAAVELLDSVAESDRGNDYWIVRANTLLQGADLPGARDALARLESAEPSADLFLARARMASAAGDAKGARDSVQQALDADGADPEAWLFSAWLAREADMLARSEEDLARAIALFRERSQQLALASALSELVQVQLAQGRLEEAENTVAQLNQLAPDSITSHYMTGLVALQKGESARAVEVLRRAAALAPDQPAIDAALGSAYLGGGNFAQAEQRLLAALDPARPSPAVVRMLAEARLRQGRAQAAIDALDRLDPRVFAEDHSLALLRASAYLEVGDAASATPLLELALAAAPESFAASVLLARSYNLLGRNDEAARIMVSSPAFSGDEAYSSIASLMLQVFQRQGPAAAQELVSDLLAKKPGDASALMVAATLRYLSNDPAGARTYTNEVLTSSDTFLPALLLAATLEVDAGQTAEAEQYLRRALQADPSRAPAALALARLRLTRNDTEGARAVLRNAAAAADAPPGLLAALGDLERQLGDTQRATAIARELRERFPQEFAGFWLEGRLAEQGGNHAAAGRAYRSAYELRPSWGFLRSAVAALHAADDGDWEMLLRSRLQAEPLDIVSRLLLADTLQLDGRAVDALTEYRAALLVDGVNVVALNNAAWLLYDSEPAQALRYAQRAAELAPDNAAVLDTFGWLLVREGRAAEALPHLEIAAQLAPETRDIRYHLAVAQAGVGDGEGARRTLETLLADARLFSERQAAEALLRSL